MLKKRKFETPFGANAIFVHALLILATNFSSGKKILTKFASKSHSTNTTFIINFPVEISNTTINHDIL